ncbi:MAG: hypothetical protein RLY86_2071 [Pseudomonadota bacterium]
MRASVTLREYNMSGERLNGDPEGPVELPNYFKEAGHLAFWITRMKPLRLASSNFVKHALDIAKIGYDESHIRQIFGSSVNVPVLINEYAALYVAQSIIVRAERERLRRYVLTLTEKEAAAASEEFNSLRQQAKKKVHRLTSYVFSSLRYDVHSPNSVALLFEALMGTGFPFPPDEIGTAPGNTIA